MDTSRTQVERRLDPENDRVQLDTLVKAAHAVGRGRHGWGDEHSCQPLVDPVHKRTYIPTSRMDYEWDPVKAVRSR
jgi:hypothetical protein